MHTGDMYESEKAIEDIRKEFGALKVKYDASKLKVIKPTGPTHTNTLNVMLSLCIRLAENTDMSAPESAASGSDKGHH